MIEAGSPSAGGERREGSEWRGGLPGILVFWGLGQDTGWSESHSPGQGKPQAAGQRARELQVQEADATEGDGQEPGHGGEPAGAGATLAGSRPSAARWGALRVRVRLRVRGRRFAPDGLGRESFWDGASASPELNSLCKEEAEPDARWAERGALPQVPHSAQAACFSSPAGPRDSWGRPGHGQKDPHSSGKCQGLPASPPAPSGAGVGDASPEPGGDPGSQEEGLSVGGGGVCARVQSAGLLGPTHH